ncbi:MAG: arginine--tRNA ligase [Bacillota bacterium]
MKPIQERIAEQIISALQRTVERGEAAGLLAWEARPPITLETPKDPSHGDLATNLAMAGARLARVAPRKLAEIIVEHFDPAGTAVEKVEIAGPGFINFRLSDTWLAEAVADVLAAGPDYGRSQHGAGRRINLEFVSANPTGPMVMVQARAGAVGDVLAGCLAWAGWDVVSEYYLDDMGTQVETLGRSVEIRLRQALGEDIPFPEGAYPGIYVIEIAKRATQEFGRELLERPEAERQQVLADYAVGIIAAQQKEQLDRYRVHFDVWFSQKSLVETGYVDRALRALEERGAIFEEDGAKWIRTTSYGDDKDRVLVRSNGEPSYFLLDIAYHLNKMDRGFDHLIDIWGPDHHGHIQRMMAAMSALGLQGKLEIVISQMVRVYSGGELVRMSKRAGDFVTMEEVVDEVGVDACRFFFLMRALETHMDFDLDLAKLNTNENPVYYVQYAHARMCGILRQAAESGLQLLPPNRVDLGRLTEEAEKSLIKKLAALPGEIVAAAEGREPHRLPRYAQELAAAFHVFYDRCRVLTDDPGLTQARLALVRASQICLANVLGLLKVSAPERM